MAPKAVHFGGGMIGRGFVAEKLNLAGYEVVFLDVVAKLIDEIKNTPSYTVTEVGQDDTKVNTISNYRAINSGTNEEEAIEEIATAELVTCAVGPKVLKFIAPVIAKAIDKRTEPIPLAVIACENMIGATDALAAFIKDPANTPADRLASIGDRARFANAAIDRIVPLQPDDSGLNVQIESFYEWVVDQTPFTPHGHPKVDAIHWVDDLVPYIERKLYTVNTGHATAAYYAHVRGYGMIHEALADPEINKRVHESLDETSHLIVNKHGITVDEQKQYVEKIVKRISNPLLKDTVERVARAPLRKLGRNERFVGPAHHLAEQDDKYTALLAAMEQAFHFTNVKDDDESFELGKMLKEKDAETIVATVCGLEKSDKMFGEVLEIVKRVQKK